MTDETVSSERWHEANRRALVAAIAEVRRYLEPSATEAQAGLGLRSMPALSIPASPPSALEALCETFGLSPFERGLLLLCAGMELDPDFARALAEYAQRRHLPPVVTFALALDTLPRPEGAREWSAISPAAPLRYWRFVEVKNGDSLATAPLRMDERILHYLTGVDYLDERLSGLVESLSPGDAPVASQRAVAEQIAHVWSHHASAQESSQPPDSGSAHLPAIALIGAIAAGKRAVAATVCALLGLDLRRLSVHAVPTAAAERGALALLWTREAALGRRALLLDCDGWEPTDAEREAGIARLIEEIGGPLFLSARAAPRAGGNGQPFGADRPLLLYDVAGPTPIEQRELWAAALGPLAVTLDGAVEPIIAQFRLNAPEIRAAAQSAVSRLAAGPKHLADPPKGDLARTLWDACRLQARPQLGNLAQFIRPVATWDDLVLPAAQEAVLAEIALQVRRRYMVYEQWGFAAKSSRGLGISALFVGSSGTGKTLAAEVLANDLRLDLYRIDLSAVVSKYIGETEKNLGRVFDAAEGSGAILLFDEADALFGKRSEVRDSHDRYANIEISYLLQRMEAYQGLAILTSNLKDALDTAFLRRIRFTVRFPFPDAEQRAEIWRRIFPSDTPTEKLDPVRLAQLNVAGGNIRNIALNAAFLAADAGEPVRMRHLLRAARSEYAKLEKPLAESEIRGWI